MTIATNTTAFEWIRHDVGACEQALTDCADYEVAKEAMCNFKDLRERYDEWLFDFECEMLDLDDLPSDAEIILLARKLTDMSNELFEGWNLDELSEFYD